MIQVITEFGSIPTGRGWYNRATTAVLNYSPDPSKPPSIIVDIVLRKYCGGFFAECSLSVDVDCIDKLPTAINQAASRSFMRYIGIDIHDCSTKWSFDELMQIVDIDNLIQKINQGINSLMEIL